jgi:hypothetical protein
MAKSRPIADGQASSVHLSFYKKPGTSGERIIVPVCDQDPSVCLEVLAGTINYK